MKHPVGVSTQAMTLSTKLSATFSEGFSNQYNSPKTITAKGFIMGKNPYENATLLPRPQKRDNSLTKSKASKIVNSSALESTSPSQKMSGNVYQIMGNREEKRSSSKQKCETLRTVSSTPKSYLPYKSSDSVRKEDTSYNQTQYKWKKLEISTEFNNTKNSYTNKAQTTKHTETDENFGKEIASRASPKQQPPQAGQKTYSSKNDNNSYTFYTEQTTDENKNKETVGSQVRTSRPLSSYDTNPRNAPTSPQGPTKANHQIKSNQVKENKQKADERESSVSKLSYRKEKLATPKSSQTVNNEYATNQGYSNEASKRKERPLSAKKPNRESKDEQTEKTNSKEAPKASLQGFVTKVNKGDAFGSIKKYSEKRENSATASKTQKPQLNLDEKYNKPVRAVDLDLKGPKTTPNVESKVFTINLGKSSASPTAASSQTNVTKQNKKGGSQRASQELVPRSKVQGKESFIYYQSNLERAHKWGGEPDYFVQLYQEHFLQTFQALSFCKLLRDTDPAVLAQKRVNLPRRESHKDKRTLVFDMDETLIHCNESLDMPADVILPIIFPNGEVVEAGINIRPYAIEILRELSQYFEIMVFTASHSCYANVVLDYLDPHEEFIHHRLFRESCVVTDEGLHIKDLRVIGNRNLNDLILVDNAAYSFAYQIENGIPIVPFYDNKEDQELRHLIPYLKFLSSAKDLREVNKQTFKLQHYLAHDDAEEALEKVILQN